MLSGSSGRSDQNEQILLEAVAAEVRDRQAQSLHSITLQTLEPSDPARLTQLLWQGHLHLAAGDHPGRYCQGAIGDLLDHPTLQTRLLIKGPAGIGKTTLLLELAAELVQRAKDDPEQPIPVIFHLSSWLSDQSSFGDWLGIELSIKYGVSKRLRNQWLESKLLCPLVDGLDAIPLERQATVVQQLNIWLGDNPGPLVVCCRCEDDSPAADSLALNGTLTLAPLSPEQLEQYFTSRQLNELWMRLHQQSEWLDLMRVPLWLNLGLLTRKTFDFTTWALGNSPETWPTALLDAFIAQQLHTPLPSQRGDGPSQPAAQQTRRWLGWLAKHIHDQSEHEFQIENMQPTLLESRSQIIQYSLLGGVLFGVMGGLIFGLFIGPGSGLFVTSVIFSLFVIRRGDDAINAIDTKPTATDLMKFIFVRQVNYLLFFGLLAGLVLYGHGVSLVFGIFLSLLIIFLVRLGIALPSLLLGRFVFRVNRFLEADISIRTKPNQGFDEIRLYMLRSTLMFLPILFLIRITPLFWSGQLAGPIPVEVTSLLKAFSIIAAIALWATLFPSALACAQHLALRLVLFRHQAIPWNYARFLKDCCDRHLLQRVGGRYQFIHPLVQERFAAMPLGSRGSVRALG